MKILVLGGGGREHALVWKFKQSAGVEKIWCAPGNGGIVGEAECLSLDLANPHEAAALAANLAADLTVVGPELPLVKGISDTFATRGLAILGPSAQAAKLEGSKIFAKEFLRRHDIPTAAVVGICDSFSSAIQTIDRCPTLPIVLKADGLCAGKGVLVATSRDAASDFIHRAFELQEFGDAGSHLLIEEGLRGNELSYIILTDGTHFIRMAPSRDHKRAFDGDTGPNTGGMGAYSTDELLPPELESAIIDTVVRPTLRGLQAEGIPYRGFLYFGLMLTPEGPKVLEYNCRLGDPETQAVLLRANFDFADACFRAATSTLSGFSATWSPKTSACVVLASEGYPQHPIIGREITDLTGASATCGTVVFQAGTRRQGHKYYSTAGRVLAVAASGPELVQTLRAIYNRLAAIRLENGFYRKDIGASAADRHATVG